MLTFLFCTCIFIRAQLEPMDSQDEMAAMEIKDHLVHQDKQVLAVDLQVLVDFRGLP